MPTPSAGSKANHTRPCLHFQHKTRVLSKSYKRRSRGCWGAAWGALHNGPPELGVQTRHACLSPGWARAGAAAPGGELTGPALTTRGDKCLCPPPRPEPVRPRHNVQLSVSRDEAPGGPGGRGRLPTWHVQDLYLNTGPGVCATHNASTVPAHATRPGPYTRHALAVLTPAGFGQSPRTGQGLLAVQGQWRPPLPAPGAAVHSADHRRGRATDTSGHPEPACGRCPP